MLVKPWLMFSPLENSLNPHRRAHSDRGMCATGRLVRWGSGRTFAWRELEETTKNIPGLRRLRLDSHPESLALVGSSRECFCVDNQPSHLFRRTNMERSQMRSLRWGSPSLFALAPSFLHQTDSNLFPRLSCKRGIRECRALSIVECALVFLLFVI